MFESHLEMLYVAPERWRRGINRALLTAIAPTMRADGARNMSLRTLRLSAARTFYERLGARQVFEEISYGQDAALDTAVLGFDDLFALRP